MAHCESATLCSLPHAKTEIQSATTCCDLPKAAFKPVIPPLRQAVPFYVLPFGPPSLRDASLALRLLRVTPPSEAATLRDSTFGDGQAIDMLNQRRPQRALHSKLPASQFARMTRKHSPAQQVEGIMTVIEVHRGRGGVRRLWVRERAGKVYCLEYNDPTSCAFFLNYVFVTFLPSV